MSYKYTYQDWEEGKIIWNDVESNKYENNYISKECIAEIKIHQQKTLDIISYRYTENLVKGYIADRRKSRDRDTLVSGLLKTIDNLLNKDVDSFRDTITLDEKQAITESIPKERKVKVIPPLNWLNFDSNEIYWIQNAYSNFLTWGQWNTEVIETPIEEELPKYIESKISLPFSFMLLRLHFSALASFSFSIVCCLRIRALHIFRFTYNCDIICFVLLYFNNFLIVLHV